MKVNGSYSRSPTVDFGNFSTTSEAKIDKDGAPLLTMSVGENKREAVVKAGGKGAVKMQEGGWQSFSELENASEGGRARQFLLRRLQNFKSPATEAADLAGKVKEVKKEGEAYSGELSEAAAKELLAFGRRRGGDAPE